MTVSIRGNFIVLLRLMVWLYFIVLLSLRAAVSYSGVVWHGAVVSLWCFILYSAAVFYRHDVFQNDDEFDNHAALYSAVLSVYGAFMSLCSYLTYN